MKVKQFIKCIKDPELYGSKPALKKMPIRFFTNTYSDILEAAYFYVTEIDGKVTLCIGLEPVE